MYLWSRLAQQSKNNNNKKKVQRGCWYPLRVKLFTFGCVRTCLCIAFVFNVICENRHFSNKNMWTAMTLWNLALKKKCCNTPFPTRRDVFFFVCLRNLAPTYNLVTTRELCGCHHANGLVYGLSLAFLFFLLHVVSGNCLFGCSWVTHTLDLL